MCNLSLYLLNKTLEKTEGAIMNGQSRETGNKKTLEKTEGAIMNGQSRETGNIRYTRHKTKTNQTKHNTISVGHHYTKTNTNNVNKT